MSQPQVLPELKLLARGYKHGATLSDNSDAYTLDLWGFHDSSEWEVIDATLTGTTISLCGLANFSRLDFMRMTDWYSAVLIERNAEMRISMYSAAQV